MARKKMTPVLLMDESMESEYDRAMAKAQDPNMTTADNPLATQTAEEAAQERIVDRNFETLMKDAALKRKPGTGGVYTGIMDLRYGR